jgi:hypothetical protein
MAKDDKQKAERLAAALRENLRRRKAQSRDNRQRDIETEQKKNRPTP